MDTSIPAVQAGDLTLATACENLPGRGADICRFKDGTPIGSDWVIILPPKGKIKAGTVVVDYKDIEKSYDVPVTGLLRIPFSDIIPDTEWSRSEHSFTTVQARAKIIYQGNTTVEEWQARAIALLIVTSPDYDPLPMDSGIQLYTSICKLQYTSAGRSALQCQ